MKLKAIAAAALAAPLVVACGSTENAKAPYKLNGAGATFPAPYYNAVLGDLAKATGNKVNYQAVGSGAGVRQFTAKTVDFGASDGAVSDAKQKLPMVHIPMTGGAIVPAYNYPGCDAKMTQTQLADVFLGKITNWSEFGCADKNIVTVHRSDGSGTTKGFPTLCLPSLLSGKQRWALVSPSLCQLVSVVKVTLVLPLASNNWKVLSVI